MLVIFLSLYVASGVALFAEGVDRNFFENCLFSQICVALFAEGVDRNPLRMVRSDPTRTVALLAEGVDRNFWRKREKKAATRSPSSRRAWIEITSAGVSLFFFVVALLAEGVDRNAPSLVAFSGRASRPPRGGRG